MDYIDTWGLYQCFQGTDDEMVIMIVEKIFLHYNQIIVFNVFRFITGWLL